ncbi:MAG: glycosyltransferase family 2 protein [Agathobacter sp.]
MKEQIKISVIVPAYNAELWIQRCVESICSQTYTNLEIILIDDGSTDNTKQLIDGYASIDDRIIAIHQQNLGLVATREKGITLATGDYVTFVDADDVIEQNMYERLIRNALKYNADISHCGMRFCYPDGREESHYGTDIIRLQDKDTGLIDLLEGKRIEPTLCNKLYRSSLLYDSCLDKNILNNEDLLRNYVLFERANISVFEDFCGYQYMQNEGSMSNNQTRKIEIATDIIRARRMIVDNCSENIKPYAIQSWLSAIITAFHQMSCCTDKEQKEFCIHCRKILKQEKKNLIFLIKRQQIAAQLIIHAPWLHHIVYNIYRKKHK